MEILQFVFQSFWHFVGFLFLLASFGNAILAIWTRLLRYWTIRKHGYPPSHCDADGDFKQKEDKKEENE